MYGTLVNTAAIIIGSVLGLVSRGGIPRAYQETIMHAIGLVSILIGLKGALKTDAILLVIISLAIGAVIGEALRIEAFLEKIGGWLEMRLAGRGGSVAKGFVTASLLFCTGSMAIVGALESGLMQNHQTLLAKSIMDCIASVIFTATLGIGVIFSAVSVLLYQGSISLTAAGLKQFLTPEVITQMSAVGGVLIMALGINLLELKRLRVANMLPAIFMPLLYFMLKQILHIS